MDDAVGERERETTEAANETSGPVTGQKEWWRGRRGTFAYVLTASRAGREALGCGQNWDRKRERGRRRRRRRRREIFCFSFPSGFGFCGEEFCTSMRMMLMMMQHPVVETLDGSSSDEQHVVVGRMEMGPEIVPRLLEDNNGTNRVLYGQKVIVDEEEDEGEEEEEEEEGGRGGGGGEDHGGVHQLLSRNAHKLQLLQQHGYENHHHPAQQIAATNGEEEEEDHHHHNGDDVYGVRSGQQHRHHEDEEEDEEPKLGELGSVMLRLDSGNNLGESITGRERPPPAIDGDIGIVQQSPHRPDTSSGGGGGGKSGRGRTSREPAIEWSEGATTVLLQAFGDKYRALDRGNFTSKIWADIAARVNAHEITSTVWKKKFQAAFFFFFFWFVDEYKRFSSKTTAVESVKPFALVPRRSSSSPSSSFAAAACCLLGRKQNS